MATSGGNGGVRAVYERFAGADPELANGFAEHAPMGADALAHLGCTPEAVEAWAARHDPRPLDPASDLARTTEALLERIEDAGWAEVVAAETAALAPHVDAHLFHGLIRTAHAVRTIRTVDAAWSRRELVIGLASWQHWAARGDAAPPAAPAAVSDPLGVVLEAARRGAGAFLTNRSIFTLHAVTGPLAFALLADHVDPATAAAAAVAFERSHARHGAPPAVEVGGPPDPARLTQLADAWDAHPAKLVEAALRGHSATGDPVFLAAAESML